MTGPDLHALLDVAGAWEVVAAVFAGELSRAAAAEILGLDEPAFDRLVRVARERMKQLARRALAPVGV